MKTKKIILTSIISVLIFIFITGYGSIFFFVALSIPSFIIRFFACILIIFIYFSILYLLYKVIKSRVKEIEGGDFDDLGKY